MFITHHQGTFEWYLSCQAEQRLIRQKVKRKKRPSHISSGGGRNHNLPSNTEVPTSKGEENLKPTGVNNDLHEMFKSVFLCF